MKTILASQFKSQTQTKPMTEKGDLPYEHCLGAEAQSKTSRRLNRLKKGEHWEEEKGKHSR